MTSVHASYLYLVIYTWGPTDLVNKVSVSVFVHLNAQMQET